MFPADEFERIAAPEGSSNEATAINGHASLAALLRDSAAGRRLMVYGGAVND
jgi:hypothetical protein